MRRQFLLFDHDGVLVDTERWYFAATREALAPFRVELDEPTYLTLMAGGRSCWDLARARGAEETQIRRGREARDDLYRSFLRTRDIEIDGVAETLSLLARTHTMAIVTTSRKADFELVQGRRSLLQHFAFWVTVEDYAHAKPHPDPYLTALRRLGADPAGAVAIEDSARGLASAVAAGLDCVVVRNRFTASQDFSQAWRVVDSIRELPALV